MKTFTRQEIIDLVKAKKLPMSVLKPYQEKQEDKEPDNEKKLIEAIFMLVSAISKSDNSKAILETIKNQPETVFKPEINIEIPEVKETEWQFDIERDSYNLISCIKAKPI